MPRFPLLLQLLAVFVLCRLHAKQASTTHHRQTFTHARQRQSKFDSFDLIHLNFEI
jgi:hypothetical protein